MLKKALIISLLLLSFQFCFALKLGYVDSRRALKEFKGNQELQEKFSKEVASWRAKAEEKAQEIKNLEQEYKSQSVIWTEEKRAEAERVIKTKMESYNTFMQETFGENGVVEKRNKELMKPIITKMMQIIQKIAVDDKYDYIFDASYGGMIYADKAADLTGRVIEELNKSGL
ncbi:MAG: OmpH family outer membrane protein [Candidatus Coatesbacteria bacterium]|nr:OmpH family outer membrane protein [Candidatus Coatesbacteria bacterium]